MKTYNIITIGCQMNKSDSERVAGYLEEFGLKYEEDKNQADLVVLNTCGVRQSAEDRIYGIVPRIKKANTKVKIILTGCLSQRKDVQKKLAGKVDIWLNIIDLPGLARKLCDMRHAICDNNYLNILPKYQSKFSAFVPIGNGCNNFCAYCVVPYARGREIYRDVEDILKEVRSLIKKRYKEIILIAQNVNSYKSGKTNFSDLLRKVNNIPGDFWIRFATSHPKDMSEDLIKTIAECSNPPSSRLRRARVCEYIHLPVQAGDNEILKKMNRKYTREQYLKLIRKIRKAIPSVSITTDLIVGFPSETRKQFENSKELFKKVKFDMAYVAQYSPRPGTAAGKLKDDVPKSEKKKREEEIMKILRKTALENNKKYINKTVEVLTEGKNKKGEWFGKTRTSKNVKFQNPNDKYKIGEFVKVKIKKVKDFGLEGELLK